LTHDPDRARRVTEGSHRPGGLPATALPDPGGAISCCSLRFFVAMVPV